MSAKKKDKIKRLTEEEYNQYLMSLKDEAPVRVNVGKDGKKYISET